MDKPKTYNSQEAEKKWQAYWEQEKIYAFKQPKDKNMVYSIDTPPPYVSADHLHVGHALSYSQADFIARYQRMRGKHVFYPMGFDDNGLPTERFVEKKYNVNKSKITRQEFIQLCLKDTEIGARTYQKLWNALGISVDWSLSYSTIDKRCQKIAQKSFLDLYHKKRMQRREEPIMWCSHCCTALAQADLDDLQKSSFLHEIQFTAEDGKPLVISTSRPELLPACVALFVHKQDKRYKHLLGKKATVPLFNYTVPILGDDRVDMDFGTGLMMVCTFGDAEDIERWKTHKLHTRVILDKQGRLNSTAGKYQDLRCEEARKNIVDDLQQAHLLKDQKQITHVTNVHERCSTPIEFLIAPQWYIHLLDIKKELLAIAQKINWYPEYMRVRYDHWVENLKWDWCISRERFYGVPFPVWYCKKCQAIILPKEEELPVDPTSQLPSIKQCPTCKHTEFLPETDVMDTWMTSSVTPLINSYWKEKNELKEIYPMSLRPQAHDIIRTWAFYTIAKSWLHTKSVPWFNIMISGHGLDAQGQKISKSKGNMIIADVIIQKYSADALRFFAASTKLGDDSLYQEKELVTGQKTVTKLWNSGQFMALHLQDAPPKRPSLELMDQWLFTKLMHIVQEATAYFDTYEFSKAKAVVDTFFWHTFCDQYLEIVKDRLYNPEQRGKGAQHSAQYTLHYALLTILKLFAPFMPYITEELYMQLFSKTEKQKSIHLSAWPVVDKKFISPEVLPLGDRFVQILSEARQFKSKQHVSLKTPIVLTLEKKDYTLLQPAFADLQAACQAPEIKQGTFCMTLL